MKWYAYNEYEANGTTYVNMILDHNTTQKIQWINASDYNRIKSITQEIIDLGLSYPKGISSSTCSNIGTTGCGTSKGPITLLSQLKNDTKNWQALSNRNDSYEALIGPYPMTNDYSTQFIVNYSNYKARLFTLEEYNNILHGGLGIYNEICSWLKSNMSNDGNPTHGYWTSSFGTYAGNVAFTVGGGAVINTHEPKFGVRPVITLPKSTVGLD